MSYFKERALQEKKELSEKLTNLINFFDTDNCKKLNENDLLLLHWQAKAMADYKHVLNMRIERF